MPLSVGIVGLPNVGKSTLFKALTKKEISIANYPFCTVDPNVGVVRVPDKRLEKLAALSNSKKITPSTIEFVDIAGLVKGANKGEGLGNQFLAKIREVDGIAHLVRIFEDGGIVHIDKTINPKRDIETINLELIMKDIETLKKRIEKVSSEARSGDKEKKKELAVFQKAMSYLEQGQLLNQKEFDQYEKDLLKPLCLLTAKPMIIVFNSKIESKKNPQELEKILKDLNLNLPFVEVDIKLEADLGELDEQEKRDYKRELGINQDGIDQIISSCYRFLRLITFLTTGRDETRAWTIKENTKAIKAAGVIHSDFEKKFIKVEVINWQTLIELGGWTQAAKKGMLRVEGKDYIVRDGDVLEFKI
ncbi:MAG TPA: redox-regulated ATPase YchF [bacterium]|nr:redox-regulated ATPase YchF [bacterium]